MSVWNINHLKHVIINHSSGLIIFLSRHWRFYDVIIASSFAARACRVIIRLIGGSRSGVHVSHMCGSRQTSCVLFAALHPRLLG